MPQDGYFINSYFILVLRCSQLIAPVNGRLENAACGNVYGSVCQLACYRGYELKGSVLRKCDNITGTNVAQWTGNTTSCEGKYAWVCLIMSGKLKKKKSIIDKMACMPKEL